MRKESDFLGSVDIPDDVLYGIHSLRAQNNFPHRQDFDLQWFQAMGQVKLAVFRAYEKFLQKGSKKFDLSKFYFNRMSSQALDALKEAASEISQGKYFESFIVPAISGGAGTSINMNMNEILANVALIKMDKRPGDYQQIDPLNDANIFQSTNDVVPTALKVAVMGQLQALEKSLNNLRQEIEKKEQQYRDLPRVAYTQLQAAVPSTFGRLFSNYQEMLSRDWWRISKSFERIKVVNLGGSAVGTGLTVPQFMIFEMVEQLKELTSLPVCRGENLTDATSNLDSLVEVHAILKAHAVNLEKMSSDLRLLASELCRQQLVTLPPVQAGSSIMPHKVNPVIAEYVISCCHRIYANDQTIASLCAQGALDLNAYLPVIGHAMLESLHLMISCNQTLADNMIKGLMIDEKKAQSDLLTSPTITTALIPYIGYQKATEIAGLMRAQNLNIYQAAEQLQILSTQILEQILAPSELIKMGYSLSEIEKWR